MDERMMKLLAALKGAGLDVSSLEATGGLALGDFLRDFAQADGNKPQEALDKKLADMQADRDRLQKLAMENEERYKGKDRALSDQDLKIKALTDELSRVKIGQAATDTQIPEYLKGLQATVESISKQLDQERAARQALEAEAAWKEQIELLARSIPALNDPKLRSLLPRTNDKAVLESAANTLAQFAEASERDAFQKVRDGYVPPSSPPRVLKGDAASFEREVERIGNLVASREMSAQKGQDELARIAEMMKPGG
jgi:hypothetical protein